jgi:lipoxygenase
MHIRWICTNHHCRCHCCTGRARTEKRDGHHYVHRDERFSKVKQLTFGAMTLRSDLHALLLSQGDLPFPHFPGPGHR